MIGVIKMPSVGSLSGYHHMCKKPHILPWFVTHKLENGYDIAILQEHVVTSLWIRFIFHVGLSHNLLYFKLHLILGAKPKHKSCKTCPFISNTVKISGPNRSVKVTDHYTCISSNVIYCITCTLCKKIYIGETGRTLADRFREHLRDAEQNNTCVQTSRAPFQSS